MKEEYKKIIEVIIYIIIFLGIIILLFFLPKREKINDKNYNIYNNERIREEKIKEFENGKIIKKENKYYDENSGGYNKVILKNRKEILEKTDLDTMIEIEKIITDNIEELKDIIRKDKNVEIYYENNKKEILNVFGIDNKENFINLYNKIKKVSSTESYFIEEIEKKEKEINITINIGNEKFNLNFKEVYNKDYLQIQWII